MNRIKEKFRQNLLLWMGKVIQLSRQRFLIISRKRPTQKHVQRSTQQSLSSTSFWVLGFFYWQYRMDCGESKNIKDYARMCKETVQEKMPILIRLNHTCLVTTLARMLGTSGITVTLKSIWKSRTVLLKVITVILKITMTHYVIHGKRSLII